MEVGRNLLSPISSLPNIPRTHHPRNPLSSISVLMLHDQASKQITSLPTTSIVRQVPPSVFTQEAQNDYKTCNVKEEKVIPKTMDRQHVELGLLLCEESEKEKFDQYLKYFECRLLYQPGLWYQFTAPCTEEYKYLAMATESVANDTNVASVQPGDVLALAKRAMMASKKAALLAEKSNTLESECVQSHFLGSDLNGFTQEVAMKDKTVIRSKWLLERRSKRRKLPKNPDNVVCEVSSAMIADLINKKIEKGLNTEDPLRLFLWGPETKQLLTIKEEKELFLNLQELMRLEEVKQRLLMQFSREPTLNEWAEAVGMDCQVLHSCIRSGNRSREKMIYANFRLVIHVAKQYEGKGLNIQDLLQEGSRGLMKSLEKFKPKAGCRFPTYAYWWIRQSIRKAIFQNSRAVRLPENVFALLKKIKDARRLCIQEGHIPTNQELAKRVGIRVEKLGSLLLNSRNPLSIQERAWVDQDVTVQEITADTEVEIPDLTIAKKMMRQHVRYLLGFLNHRERQIIEFRYGLHDNERKSLSEIGAMYGLTKERVRQLETRAMDKLKDLLPCQGLEAYVNLLI